MTDPLIIYANKIYTIYLKMWIKLITNREFDKRYKKIFKIHPELLRPIEKKCEKEHITLWKKLCNDINLNTLRMCSNLSGECHPAIVPEEVFASHIQRSLCKEQEHMEWLGNKSFYNRWYKNGIFPEAFLHNIDGELLNKEYKQINQNELDGILNSINYPVVIKPNIGSWGGFDINFPESKEELKKLMNKRINFVVQEKINQHKFFSKFNEYGLNTIRINIYRSVRNNEPCFLNANLRMGRKGCLDNLTAGGILCLISEDGYLKDYAVDKFGGKYFYHPDTNIKFSKENRIPQFEEMKKIALIVSKDLYFTKLLSVDMCLDQKNNWRMIEVNLFDIAIRAGQWGGQPFFGQYTKEVIEYCVQNPWWKK